jgi:EmrB/QacA subfamily drug resistance transporter
MGRFRGNPWAILIALCLGFFMTLLDLTIVNIAIPNMIDKLDITYDHVLWVINAYILVLAVLLITAGRLGDLLGKRNLYMAGIAIFTVASLLCGVSQSPGQLIAARAVQGLGAAMLMPQTMSIIVGVFPAERRGSALGVWGAVAGVATIAGPTLGGLLVSAFDWRWIFFINLPIGIFVLIVTPLVIPTDERMIRKHAFDVPGVVLVSLALFCITFALNEGQRYDWGKLWSFISIPALLIAGGVLLVVFFVYEARRQDREPLVPFALFRDRNYAIMNFASGALSIGMTGMFISFTIYLQSVLGMSALAAGLLSAPMSLISVIIAPIAGKLSDTIGGKYIVFTGLSLFTIGLIILQPTTHAGSSRWDVLPGLFVMGFGMGCTFAPLATVAMRNISPQLAGAASGVMNTNRQIGSVIGSAACGALLQNRIAAAFNDEATKRAGTLPASAQKPFIKGFRDAASQGLQLGAGQSGGATKPPPGTSPNVIRQINGVAHEVFTHGYVTAMHITNVLPIVTLGIGALSCLFLKRRAKATKSAPQQRAAAVDTA